MRDERRSSRRSSPGCSRRDDAVARRQSRPHSARSSRAGSPTCRRRASSSRCARRARPPASSPRSCARCARYGDRRSTWPTGAIDTCGTGGDRSGTVNVSTMAALDRSRRGRPGREARQPRRVVAAAAPPTCSRRSASRSSSARSVSRRCVEEAGVGFCFAPRYHPAMRFLGPARARARRADDLQLPRPARQPRTRAPAGDRRVAIRRWRRAMLGALRELGTEHAMMFHGDDGLDELTTTTTSTVHELVGGEIRHYTVDPAAFGTRSSDGRGPVRRRRHPQRGVRRIGAGRRGRSAPRTSRS